MHQPVRVSSPPKRCQLAVPSEYSGQTYDIISNVSLDNNLILSLWVLGHTTSCGKFASELFCCFLEVYAKELQTVYMGLMFPLCPL
jgi:hypothetical protein